MKYLGRPSIDPLSGHDAARSRVQDVGFARRLADACPEVAEAAALYVAAAARGALSATNPFVLADITNAEMSQHYDRRFAQDKSAGRHIYDSLRARAAGRCPYCRTRPVSALDHYWPKHAHASIALVPDNLVPCCGDCNKAKGTYQPKTRAGELLHPYFDVEPEERWLKAEAVRALEGPVIVFAAEPPSTWPADDAGRVHQHFTRLKLGDHYSILAVDQIGSMVAHLEDLLLAGDAAHVQEYLERLFLSACQREPNGWRTALFQALAEDPWFCAGGFSDF